MCPTSKKTDGYTQNNLYRVLLTNKKVVDISFGNMVLLIPIQMSFNTHAPGVSTHVHLKSIQTYQKRVENDKSY